MNLQLRRIGTLCFPGDIDARMLIISCFRSGSFGRGLQGLLFFLSIIVTVGFVDRDVPVQSVEEFHAISVYQSTGRARIFYLNLWLFQACGSR